MIIATTRFNDVTVHENIKWCNENNFNGIIINTSCKSSSKIPFNSEVLVICMLNLDRIKNNGCGGKIYGFTIINNRPVYSHNTICGRKFDNFNIYSRKHYNRFSYLGPNFLPLYQNKIEEQNLFLKENYGSIKKLELALFME